MKKIAITLNSLWNIYNFRLPLIADIVKSGYEILVIAPKDTDDDKLKELGYEFIELKKLSRKGTNPFKDLALISELKQIYKANNVDLVLHFTIKPNIYGSIAANQLGIPSIAVVTGLGYTFLSTGISSKAAKLLYRYAFKRNNLTIFQNYDDQKLFIESGLVSKQKSDVVLGSGIDMQRFNNKNINYTRKNKILFVGRLLFDKGIRELLEGFQSTKDALPNVELNVVGDIDANNPSSLSNEDIQKYKSDNRIIFHGFSKDVRPFIEDSDVVVLPSYREGLPRTMLEAIAMARPIITTDVPGCREVIDDKINGYMIPVQDSKSLGEAITSFYNLSEEEFQQMGQHGHNMANTKFSCDVINKEYLSIISNILK